MNVTTPSLDWFALAPVLTLLGAGGIGLLAAVLLPRRARKAAGAVSAFVGFAGALGWAAALYAATAEASLTVAESFNRDRYAALAQVIVAGAGLLAVLVSWNEPFAAREREHAGEFYALLAATGAGMAFLVAANDLMTLFLGLEWFSIGLYVLCGIAGERATSLEAALKYLVVGSFGSAVLLFGSALVYGVTGELDFGAIAEESRTASDDAFLLSGLAMIVAGLGFKASAAPFHMWTPDVYQGAPTPVTSFMSAATKTVALVLTLRVLVTAFPEQEEFWSWAIAAVAVVSLAWGNLAALAQRDVKRILAYSAVAQSGFMLIPIAAGSPLGGRALLYYLIPYSAMSLGAFAILAVRERELLRPVSLEALAGFGWERPFLGVAMSAFMFGFAGLPATGGFVAKFYAFSAAYEAGWTWLVIVGVVATAVSLYYYLAVVRAMYMRAEPVVAEPERELRPAVVAGGAPPRELLVHTAVAVCLVVAVGSLFAVQPLIELARDAVAALPF